MRAHAVAPADLAATDLLGSLPAPALAALARRAHRRSIAAGRLVVREGEPGDQLFIACGSGLQVIHRTPDCDIVLGSIAPGEVFGELAVLTRSERTATVIATAPCDVIAVHDSDFTAVLEAYPTAMRSMLGHIATKLTFAKEALVLHNHELEQRVRERTAQLRESQLEVVRRMGQLAEAHDDDTGQHVGRMSLLCAELGRAAGLPEHECETLLHAAAMHDIGKIAVPHHILRKPGPLDADEWAVMRRHTTIGARMLSGSESPILRMAEVIALSHHERWDGHGYPLGLSGEEIPLVGRIVAVCDVFDALTSDRPYKEAWPAQDALAEIEREAGCHFDARLAALFADLRRAQAGSPTGSRSSRATMAA